METIRFFPFSAGIPWRLKKGKYIIPKLDQEVWEGSVLNKDIVILVYGGLIESFFSLTIAKCINKNYPDQNVVWAGYEDFYNLINSCGVKTKEVPDIGNKYPVPLFFDKNNFVYINVLNNYIKTKPFYQTKEWNNKEIILKQLFTNSLFDWNIKYLPTINTHTTDVWLKSHGINHGDKFVFIVPYKDVIGSIHKNSCLGWDLHNVRELAAILYQKGIRVIVPSENKFIYDGSKVLIAPYDFSIIAGLIFRSSIVLSENIDHLLLSLCLNKSRTKIVSRKVDDIYDLYKNADFLNSDKEIIMASEISTMDVVVMCEEL